MTSQLTTDLDTTADLPNESTTDLTPIAAASSRVAEPVAAASSHVSEPITAVSSHASEPLAPARPTSPLDEQPFAQMPALRASGFFAFAACALAAIFATILPRRELSAPDTTPPTRVAQLEPIHVTPRFAEAHTITSALGQPTTAAAIAKVSAPGAPASLITFASRSLVTSEQAVAAVFIIKRSKVTTGKAIVHWSARSGSADAGIDFSDASGTARFADGQRQVAIYVPLRNDLLQEGDETFKVCLRSPQQARIAGGSCAETTIRDDDVVSRT